MFVTILEAQPYAGLPQTVTTMSFATILVYMNLNVCCMKELECPAQSPNHKPIEHPWLSHQTSGIGCSKSTWLSC